MTEAPEDISERVRRRAYELWEQAGRPHGRSDEFWEQATLDVQQGVIGGGRGDGG